MKFHLCFVSFNNSFVVLLDRRFSQVVCSPSQLRNSCSTILECLQRFGVSAQRILFVPPRCQCCLYRQCSSAQSQWKVVYPSAFVVWLKPLAVRLICTVVSVMSRFVKASAGSHWPPTSKTRSGNKISNRVDTVAFIIYTCSSHAVAQPHEHSDVGF